MNQAWQKISECFLGGWGGGLGGEGLQPCYMSCVPQVKIEGNNMQDVGFQPVLLLLSEATCEDF